MLSNLVSGLVQELAAGREEIQRAAHVKPGACDRETYVVGEDKQPSESDASSRL